MNKVEGLSKDELLEKYLPLVRSIAHQIRQRLRIHLEVDELVQDGQIGLMEAADRFDSKLGVSFKTFAYYRIKGSIYDGLRKMDVISRRKNSKLMFEAAATEFLAGEAVRGSTETRKATLKDDIDEVVGMISGLVPILILTSDAMDQFQQDQHGRSQDQQVALKQERAELRKAMNELSDKERQLLEFHYYQDLTLEQSASNLGLSKSWASRLHAKAISKLQEKMARKARGAEKRL